MEKTLGIELKDYKTIPSTLLGMTSAVPVDEITVNMANLYHHYYLDKHDTNPPNPDPAHFEYTHFLCKSGEFRLLEDGIGASTGHKRNVSNEIGQSFCRLFLHDHLGIKYFAHMDKVLDKEPSKYFGDIRVERGIKGDVPDYLCASNKSEAFVAEAKGRYSGISFSNKEFEGWREQFTRIVVKDAFGKSIKLKGHIVATRFATESQPRSKSKIYAEDPSTPGQASLNPEVNFGGFVASQHLGNIASKLRQPLLAAALTEGFTIQNELRFPAAVWSFVGFPQLQGRRFVGGYFPNGNTIRVARTGQNTMQYISDDPFRLDIGSATFFGIDEEIFKMMAAMARNGPDQFRESDPFEGIGFLYSALSFLNDGSIIGPIEFFQPIDIALY